MLILSLTSYCETHRIDSDRRIYSKDAGNVFFFIFRISGEAKTCLLFLNEITFPKYFTSEKTLPACLRVFFVASRSECLTIRLCLRFKVLGFFIFDKIIRTGILRHVKN